MTTLRVLYLLAGLTAVAAAPVADVRGWLLSSPSVLRNVPRSIRDNPGAYRALYSGSPRDSGGK